MSNKPTKLPPAARKYFAEIGAVGGRKKTPAKLAAMRENLAAARAKRWGKNGKTAKEAS